MSAGLLSLLQSQGFEVSYNSDESFYATDNKDMGLAAYTNSAGSREYYLFMKENTFNQDLLNLEQVLKGQGFKGKKGNFSSFAVSKAKMLPTIIEQYNSLLKKHKDKPLLAFVELVDSLGENETNVEQVLTGLGIKGAYQISTVYKLYKKHLTIEGQYNSLLNMHKDKPLLAFVELVDKLREEEIKRLKQIHKNKTQKELNKLINNIIENEGNIQHVLRGLGIKGMMYISIHYKLFKKHPTILDQYNNLSKKHPEKPLKAFEGLVDKLKENETNVEQVLTGLGVKGVVYMNTYYKLYKKHLTIEDQYNTLLKKHPDKPLLAFVELVDSLGENEGNVEQVLTGLGIKGVVYMNTYYKLYKKFPCIDHKFETLEAKSNPVEAVLTISQLIGEKESNITMVLNGLGYGLGPLNISTEMYKDQSFQPIRNKLLNSEPVIEDDIYDFLINFGDANYDATRKFFKKIKSGVLTQVVKRAVDKAQEEFDQIAEQVYASQKATVINLLEQGKKKGHKVFGLDEQELGAQLNLPYYVSKKLAEWALVEQFPKAKDIKDLKKQAKAKGYRLNQWTYYRAMKTIESA